MKVYIYFRFDDVWAGTYVSFAKSTKGDIYAWGLNNYYQLGTDDMENKYTPTLVSALSSKDGWQCIAGGQHHTIALDKAGMCLILTYCSAAANWKCQHYLTHIVLSMFWSSKSFLVGCW